ncbi:peptidyl-prolyl cis-trans isomerase [Massilia sp. Dwa41.01b]|uniref:peptidylprolyl isomerase n=1 Tax=unclassified Massilia TaxID=2609279 RepID=UPI0015FEFC14|nr:MULTISPECIES: peptidylprolyl isomerase [unclassified Massilia]QNA88775.1 peptidyl-prolyl cis-trans isomerase [Massilia sp. Dwa41.01b]QNA99678.1 peptidyl-prolyl cis-trans isomerase [Massilia sp. Se16.2.3]
MHAQKQIRRSFLTYVAAAACAFSLGGTALAADHPQVSIKTTMGEIVLELDQEKAPKSTANFLQYVKSGFYKGTVFHRVINDFMIQGGGYTEKLVDKPGVRKAIPSEAKNGLSNKPYTVAMARTNDPNSATSQFFINVNDNAGLDYPGQDGHGYTVFGRVVKGQETVDKIKNVVTDDMRGMQDVPVTPIVIRSATILTGDKLVK